MNLIVNYCYSSATESFNDAVCFCWKENFIWKMKHNVKVFFVEKFASFFSEAVIFLQPPWILWNGTTYNTVILPNFLVWKFCGKAQFLHSFGQFPCETAFPQNFHTRQLGEIRVFFAVWTGALIVYLVFNQTIAISNIKNRVSVIDSDSNFSFGCINSSTRDLGETTFF